MNPPVPLFGVSQFSTWPWTFEQDVENYARLGVKAIKVCQFKLDEARARGICWRAGRSRRLEPLNPILMMDTFLCTLPGAMEIVTAVDSSNFGIFVDVWHIRADAKAEQDIEECGDKIFGVHLNDWHRPRHFGNRASIGQGQINFAPLLRALHASGYQGAYTLEIFSSEHLPGSLWKSDLSALIETNKTAFKNAWRQAFTEEFN